MFCKPVDEVRGVSPVSTGLTPGEEKTERFRPTFRQRLLHQVAALDDGCDAAHVDQTDGTSGQRFAAGRAGLASLG